MNWHATFPAGSASIALLSLVMLGGCNQTEASDAAPDPAPDQVAAVAPGTWTPPPCDQADARPCAARDLAEAERKMEIEYRAAIDRIQNCEPADSTRCYNLPHAIELIEAEQSAWLAWRNAHCDVVTFGMEDTSAEGLVRADCRTPLTIERTSDLSELRKD